MRWNGRVGWEGMIEEGAWGVEGQPVGGGGGWWWSLLLR